jgi:Leucine-rich repeat (LRR) protein
VQVTFGRRENSYDRNSEATAKAIELLIEIGPAAKEAISDLFTRLQVPLYQAETESDRREFQALWTALSKLDSDWMWHPAAEKAIEVWQNWTELPDQMENPPDAPTRQRLDGTDHDGAEGAGQEMISGIGNRESGIEKRFIVSHTLAKPRAVLPIPDSRSDTIRSILLNVRFPEAPAMRFLIFGLILTLVGCGGGEAPKEKPKVVIAPPKEEPKEVEKPKTKLKDYDLTLFNQRAVISLPEGVSIESITYVERRELVFRIGEHDFRLSERDGVTFEIAKKNLLEADPRATLLIDEPDVVLARRTNVPELPLQLIQKVSNPYHTRLMTASGPASDEARLKSWIEYGKSYRLTDEMKTQQAEAEKLFGELNKAGVSGSSFPPRYKLMIDEKAKTKDEDLKPLKALEGNLELTLFEGMPLSVGGVGEFLKTTTLLALNLTGPQFGDDWMRMLETAKGIRTVRLSKTTVSAEGMKSLATLPGLREIRIVQSPITDAHLEALASLDSLESIEFEWSTISDKGTAALRGLVNLRVLNLLGAPLTDHALNNLANLTQMRELNLSRSSINGSGLSSLRGMTGLRMLDLSFCQINDNGLSRLKLPQLTTLRLQHNLITDESGKLFSEMKTLETLGLSVNPVADRLLETLKPLTDLRFLSLDDSLITGAGLVHLKPLKHLHTVSLGRCPITDATLPAADALPAVRHLSLDGTRLTSASIPKLLAVKCDSISLTGTTIPLSAVPKEEAGKPFLQASRPREPLMALKPVKPVGELPAANLTALLKKLNREPMIDENDPNKSIIGLDLSNTPVTDQDLAELRELVTLRELNLSNSAVQGGGLSYLEPLKSLQKLNLLETPLHPESLKLLKPFAKLEKLDLPDQIYLASELQPLTELKALTDLQTAPATDEAIWIDLLAKLPNLEVIRLHHAVGFSEVKKFAKLQRVEIGQRMPNWALGMFRDHKEIRSLTIRAEYFNDGGLMQLGTLPELTTLRILDGRIGDPGINSIKGSSKLVHLHIDDASLMTDRGAADIRDLSTLAELNLNGAKLTDRALELFGELKDLETLHLPRCGPFTDAIWNHIKKLEEIRSLDLSGSKVTGKGIDAISELTRLRAINFADTQLNDDALTYLRRLPGLLEINLRGTKVTDKAVSELQAARPMLKVVR